jgi:hypothetical protein
MLPRRRWLKGAAGFLPLLLVRRALARGEVEKGVYRVRGDVRVNGVPAKPGQDIRPGDRITTGPDGELVFVVDRDAFLVRARSELTFGVEAGAQAGAQALRVVTGALLSVFGRGRPRRILTPTATIGIRGTGLYVEAEEARTYVCTCYGEVELAALDDPSARETVRTRHHEAPRYIMAKGAPQMLMSAPVINHTDAELILLESLLGRRPPFMDEPGGTTYGTTS